MTLLSWNVNGLRAALKKGFADWAAQCGADLLCLQETKCQASDLAEAALPFAHQHFHSAQKKGYSGTAVLSTQPVAAPQLDFEPGEGTEHPPEGRVQTLDCGPFLLVNVYVPNAQEALRRLPYRLDWDRDLRAHLKALRQLKPVIVCGDFNVAHQEIDLARPASNRGRAGFSDPERASFSQLLDLGFVDSFRALHPEQPGHYSWWSYRGGARSRNVGWRIDYFLVDTRLQDHVEAAWLLPEIPGSDHCPIGLRLNRSCLRCE
jgi:exodeoxyribonuclease-3